MKRIGITGANGFVGKALANYLELNGYFVTRIVRCREFSSINDHGNIVAMGDLTKNFDLNLVLEGMDSLVHLAARVHVMKNRLHDPLSEFRKVNTAATLNLARQAAASGVKRFVFLSTIKVNGEQTRPEEPFSEKDIPAPKDAYAVSKLEAEQGLYEISKRHKMDVVIIRPPLVYGPGVKANFLRLMQWVFMEVPLPLGAIHNKRSLLGLDNLLDFIMTCIEHPKAVNEVFLVADGEDLSTTVLLNRMGEALGKSVPLFSVHQKLLEISLQIMGMRHLSQRLLGSLQINIDKANRLLGWKPPHSIEEGLQKTAEDFLRARDT